MSDWQGDFGDSLSPRELVDRLYRISRHQVAKFHDTTSEKFDDLVQEGVVAGWKAADKARGNPVTYAAVTARRRITDVDLGTPMLGNENGGRPTYDVARTGRQEPEDALDGLLLAAPDLLSAVEWAYHRGTVLAVLNSLPLRQREYVYHRFWMGRTDAEIAAFTGTTREAVKSLWHRSIKPTLRRELAHLR